MRTLWNLASVLMIQLTIQQYFILNATIIAFEKPEELICKSLYSLLVYHHQHLLFLPRKLQAWVQYWPFIVITLYSSINGKLV